jgi:integrase
MKEEHITTIKRIKISTVFNRKGGIDELGKITVPNKDGKGPVQIRIYKDKRAKYFDTGIDLFPYQWNYAKGEPNIKDSQRVTNTDKIKEVKSNLEEIENKLIAAGQRYTIDDFDLTERKQYRDFLEFWRDELAAEKLNIKTKRSIQTTLWEIEIFMNDKPLSFDQVNLKFVTGFHRHLQAKKKSKDIENETLLSPNTIKEKYFKNLKKYVSKAIQHKYIKIENNPLTGYSLPSLPTSKAVLDQGEINRIEALEFKENESGLQLIRDMFLFQCYTGLRISDVKQVTENNIITDAKGISLYIKKSLKTGKEIQLTLYLLFLDKEGKSKPVELLQRHRRNDTLPIFSGYTEPYINRSLKVIAERAQILKVVSTHVGRHSFITRMINLVPITDLQQLVQHGDIKTTMGYIHYSKKQANDNLRKVKEWDV